MCLKRSHEEGGVISLAAMFEEIQIPSLNLDCQSLSAAFEAVSVSHSILLHEKTQKFVYQVLLLQADVNNLLLLPLPFPNLPTS